MPVSFTIERDLAVTQKALTDNASTDSQKVAYSFLIKKCNGVCGSREQILEGLQRIRENI